MAESVDALVSNTSGRKAVPVRSRLRVQKWENQIFRLILFFYPLVIDWFVDKLKRINSTETNLTIDNIVIQFVD